MSRLHALVLSAFLLSAPLLPGCGCSGDSGLSNLVASNTACAVSEEVVLMIDRLVESQLDNGAFDWRQNTYPFDTELDGYQNVTGATARGLLCAYEVSPISFDYLEPVLEATATYLLNLMQDLIDGNASTVSMPNYIFMRKYRDVIGLTDVEWAIVQDSFMVLAQQRDDSEGDDPNVIADGTFNLIYRVRASRPGLRGWDLSLLYRAIDCLEWPQEELDWVYDRLTSLDVPSQETYSDLSVSHVSWICAMRGDEASCQAWRNGMDGFVEDEDDGLSSFGDHQSTSYAIFARKALGEDVSEYRAWLLSEIADDGSAIESDGNEYFQTYSEMIEALLPDDPGCVQPGHE